MLPPRPIGREPAPAAPKNQPPVDDGRLWELQERVIRIETDRRWFTTSLYVALIGAGILGPAIGIWVSEQRATRYQEESARLEERVSELDRDIGELLTAFVSMAKESTGDAHAVAPKQSRGPAAPTGGQGQGPKRQPNAQDWAGAFGGRILHGPLDDGERQSMRSQWEGLDPALQQQVFTALLRRYGLDPEAFRSAIDVN
ncbi:MAG: hypothetical protein P8R42_06865 [Candidatus Binatia bacterium]|nr:hypothetical protein [Candidatus Binatia bacterium]